MRLLSGLPYPFSSLSRRERKAVVDANLARIERGSSGGYGLLVKISHDGGVETRYGHCSTLLVKSGQYVEKGEVIALVGSTGTSSGNHVHFEVRINGTPVDPLG